MLVEATMTNPLNAVAEWWHNWKAARANVASFACCGAEETGRIAHDIGVSVPQLRALAGKWPDSADLLKRRLVELGLDTAGIRRTEPQVLQDLQRVCTLCTSGRVCAHDLASKPSDPVWRDYCPNTMTLDALTAERAGSAKGA
jgi:hypothetical protein